MRTRTLAKSTRTSTRATANAHELLGQDLAAACAEKNGYFVRLDHLYFSTALLAVFPPGPLLTYQRLVRYVWRRVGGSSREIYDAMRAGFLASRVSLGKLADECLCKDRKTILAHLRQLELMGWIRRVNVGHLRCNYYILGERVTSLSGDVQEVFYGEVWLREHAERLRTKLYEERPELFKNADMNQPIEAPVYKRFRVLERVEARWKAYWLRQWIRETVRSSLNAELTSWSKNNVCNGSDIYFCSYTEHASCGIDSYTCVETSPIGEGTSTPTEVDKNKVREEGRNSKISECPSGTIRAALSLILAAEVGKLSDSSTSKREENSADVGKFIRVDYFSCSGGTATGSLMCAVGSVGSDLADGSCSGAAACCMPDSCLLDNTQPRVHSDSLECASLGCTSTPRFIGAGMGDKPIDADAEFVEDAHPVTRSMPKHVRRQAFYRSNSGVPEWMLRDTGEDPYKDKLGPRVRVPERRYKAASADFIGRPASLRTQYQAVPRGDLPADGGPGIDEACTKPPVEVLHQADAAAAAPVEPASAVASTGSISRAAAPSVEPPLVDANVVLSECSQVECAADRSGDTQVPESVPAPVVEDMAAVRLEQARKVVEAQRETTLIAATAQLRALQKREALRQAASGDAPETKRNAIRYRDLEDAWVGVLRKDNPDVTIASWGSKEYGQVKFLVDKYGWETALQAVRYVPYMWNHISQRYLKNKKVGIPSLGFLIKLHATLVPEAQVWARFIDAHRWLAERRDSGQDVDARSKDPEVLSKIQEYRQARRRVDEMGLYVEPTTAKNRSNKKRG